MNTDGTRRRPHPVLVPRPRRAASSAAETAARQRAEAAKFGARDLAEFTLDAMRDAVLSTDVRGVITYFNPAAETLTGWARTDATGRLFADVVRIVTRRACGPLNLAVPGGADLTARQMLVRRDGGKTEVEHSTSPVVGRDGTVTGSVIVVRSVGVVLGLARAMSRAAHHDALTGLPNRLLLDDRLTEAVALAARRRRLLAVLFLDLDGFKSLNDSLGHDAGDRILQSVAVRLTEVLRRSDTVGRYGGDEFVVVLPEIAHAAHAGAVGTKLLQAVAGPHSVGPGDVSLTGSLGISLYPDHGHDARTLITKADAAMYAAKRAGAGLTRHVTDRQTSAATPSTAGGDAPSRHAPV